MNKGMVEQGAVILTNDNPNNKCETSFFVEEKSPQCLVLFRYMAWLKYHKAKSQS